MGLVFTAGASLLVGGCSSSATPSLFPTVLNDPPPREDAPLKPEEVKAAVDDLISERNHLCSETMADSSGNTPHCGAVAPTGNTQSAGTAAKP